MDDKKGENYKLVQSHLDEVILTRPALIISETVLVEVMVDDVAVAPNKTTATRNRITPSTTPRRIYFASKKSWDTRSI